MTILSSLPESSAAGRARREALARLNAAESAPTSVVGFLSRGRCLVIGDELRAVAAAAALGPEFTAVVLVPGDSAPQVERSGAQTLIRGGRPLLQGALGDFVATLTAGSQTVDAGTLVSPPVERFDLVIDLGPVPVQRQAMPPLGYYAPGPDEEALAEVLKRLPEMLGEFEKPQYFEYDPEICAHGRSGKRGCTRCIDACPAEAIVSIGEQIQVNPYLCQGGGACATSCPTGAITYAYPRASDLLAGIHRMLAGYRDAGGSYPAVVFYDHAARDALADELGAAMPERVLPVEVEEIGSVGLDAWFTVLAYGAEAVVLATSDATPAQVVETAQDQLVTARAILAGMGYDEQRVRVINVDQPAEAATALASVPEGEARRPAGFQSPRDKRGRLRMAIEHLRAHAPSVRRSVPLQPGAPFGEIRVDTKACTLCMGCVSVCPTHALQDGRGLPQLNFREWNCVQCGLCERACPEDAITLSARFLYDVNAREQSRLLHEEQPFCCVVCGKPFATRSMLDRLTHKLEGHWMFKTEAARRRLEMCETCRVKDIFTSEGEPRR
ncbi:MAG TPA: 4Fe-4S binding protein [Steroidobacteraceae bacterium]|nr:4Fe-4S binding protein [Steroidobacteraceae bacterium]